MKELLQGRRLGFALRPHLGQVAVGLGIAVTLLDLAAWFQWGLRSTNGYVVAAYILAIATAVFGAIAVVTALAEWSDVADDDRGIARLDLLAGFVAVLLYAGSVAFRSVELNAAGASPAPLLLATAGLLVLIVDGVVAAGLYAGREWEEIEEDVMAERHRRRRAATR